MSRSPAAVTSSIFVNVTANLPFPVFSLYIKSLYLAVTLLILGYVAAFFQEQALSERKQILYPPTDNATKPQKAQRDIDTE